MVSEETMRQRAAKLARQRADEELKQRARQRKISELRAKLIRELRPQAAREEALARRARIKRAVDTRLCVLVDQTLRAILAQEEDADQKGASHAD